MSRLLQYHEELNERGEGKCSVPMWIGGVPGGFCDRPAFGRQQDPRTARSFAPGFACPAHGGPEIRYYMDGNMWMASRADFTNLQDSHAGFGETQELALADLTKEELTP